MSSVILTAGFGYESVAKLSLFLKSAKTSGLEKNWKIVILRDTPNDKLLKDCRDIFPNVDFFLSNPKFSLYDQICKAYLNLLLKVGASNLIDRFKSTSSGYEVIKKHFLHPTVARYFHYKDFLESHPEVSHLILTDSRDVFFQADPLPFFTDKVVTGAEDGLVEDSTYNYGWLLRLYGDGNPFLKNRQVICSGFSMGKRKAIEEYLQLFINDAIGLFPRTHNEFGLDQGIHIKLVYTFPALFTLINNGNQPISTLGTADFAQYQYVDDQVMDNLNQPVAVVHQFDRHTELKDRIFRKYGIEA